jgi:Na+:H+ antiporter, NhaA family
MMNKREETSFQEFIQAESSRGILLLLSSFVAVAWANSPWASQYREVWEIPLSITLGSVGLTKPLAFWINDGLMAMFFFVVGLEIKREVLTGELNSPRRAALPLAGALGGMIMPAALYLMLNMGAPGVRGWGIPMATDIAFSLGILSLLGRRVPLGLKTFLTALAIADDLGAILVIAMFYASDISWLSLGTGFGFLSLLMGANLVGIRHPLVYAILGIGGVWGAFCSRAFIPLWPASWRRGRFRPAPG